ncbi:MAG TPA: FIST N-terminal domain-containing protein [Cyclobacteriaceae bacterium]|nr:FIST N-terminal domain-containing protein [Cyclobacteriaceae bacterium]
MKIEQQNFIDQHWNIIRVSEGWDAEKCQLVLVFGSKQLLKNVSHYVDIKKKYPAANIVLASTAGEIAGDEVYDDTLVTTAIYFEKSTIKCAETHISQYTNSRDAGQALIQQINQAGLVSVLVIADGTTINGSELVAGLNDFISQKIPVIGGLAGDGDAFDNTVVGLNAVPTEGTLVVVGFYGESLNIGFGSLGGWDEFGPERTITRSDRNTLYEIDGKNALELYKTYLGPYVKELPGSALLFPLALSLEGSTEKLVRTILTIDEAQQSMTFAGNLPVGSKVRLMKANFSKLINAASVAAEDALSSLHNHQPELAILISCVGRKMILQQRISEEIEAARALLGVSAAITGFYSYGELSPLKDTFRCELHNQTMTITTLSEA